MDDVVLTTAAVNQHKLKIKVQALADAQVGWAKSHGSIFDAQKLKWMIFKPSQEQIDVTINFGDP